MTYQELRDAYGPTAFKLYAHLNFEDFFRDPTKSPKDINFKTGLEDMKPQQKLTFSGGDAVEAIYYAKVENGVCSHPLSRVVFNWVRVDSGDGDGTTRLSLRIASTVWALVGSSDDEVIWSSNEDDVKSWKKDYDDITGRMADRRKRSNIIDGLLAQVGPFGVLPFVQVMLADLDGLRNGYVDTYNPSFITSILSYKVNQSDGAWLETDVSAALGLPVGTTLRLAIAGSLDYDNLIIPK